MKPIMYVKSGCPWCIAAEKFFKAKNVDLVIKDVHRDSKARDRMFQISKQSKTPTLEYGDFMVADFDTDEFMDAVNKRPDIKKALGL
ncbi:MAG: glutaredoxin family protein [Opitutales bacterium]